MRMRYDMEECNMLYAQIMNYNVNLDQNLVLYLMFYGKTKWTGVFLFFLEIKNNDNAKDKPE